MKTQAIYTFLKVASILLLLGLSISACKPKNSDANSNTTATRSSNPSQGAEAIRIRTELVGDAALGAATVNVYVLEGGEGVSGATVEITGDMTHAGMIPVISQAQEIEAGLYQSQDFAFTMAGDWFLIADVELASGEKLQQQIDLTVPNR